MELIPSIVERLYQLRTERLEKIETLIDPSDPEVVNKMIADTLNLLENLFVIVNIPEDGFVSLTPQRTKDEETPSE